MSQDNYGDLIARIHMHYQHVIQDAGLPHSGWFWKGEDWVGEHIDKHHSFLTLKKTVPGQEPAFAFPPATEQQLRETEQQLGFSLPPLLRLLYTQMASGGFGPGYGITGVIGGYPCIDAPWGNIAQRYQWEIDFANTIIQRARGGWRSLIIETVHRGESPSTPALLHLKAKQWYDSEWIECFLDTLARHQELSTADILDEEKLFSNISSLQNFDPDDELLKTYLLTTYCCEILPWSPGWHWPYHGDFLLDHDERIWEWEAYTCRDEEQAALWEPFSQPVPESLRPHLLIDLQKQSSWDRTYHPRSISTPHLPGQITGFMTIEEIQNLLEQVHTHEMPPMDRLADYIERLRLVQPEEVEVYRQRYCENLWMIEKEILHRMRYALSHSKGILTYYVN